MSSSKRKINNLPNVYSDSADETNSGSNETLNECLNCQNSSDSEIDDLPQNRSDVSDHDLCEESAENLIILNN